jgi:hypothetical protein
MVTLRNELSGGAGGPAGSECEQTLAPIERLHNYLADVMREVKFENGAPC